MKKKMFRNVRGYRLLCLWVLLLAGTMGMRAQRTQDSIQVSLMTCSPGTEVYSLYGHTALRVKDYTLGRDWVFNYGVFSFSQPHFILNFVLGKCDYMVDAVTYEDFLREYEYRGSSVTEQVLNLTTDEANRILNNLVLNMQPENQTYRYNFLYNNCTTKVRDMIEGSLDGEVVYQPQLPAQTFRQILHVYTAGYDWPEVGDDLLLGQEVDTVVTDRASMFAPLRLMNYADSATIRDYQGHERPLVLTTRQVLAQRDQAYTPPFPLSPQMCAWLLLAFSVLVALAEYRFRRQLWIYDLLLMPAQGVAGLLLTFMFLFSEHPGVSSNWQIWVLHPVALFAMPWVVKCALKGQFCLYHPLNAAILTSFMIFSWWIPQDFSAIIVPLALVLLTRPLSYMLGYRKKKRK